MIDVNLKSGDTLPALIVKVIQENGTVVNLTGATVEFSMRKAGTTNVVIDSAEATVIQPESEGRVRFDWIPGTTDDIGVYEAEFRVSYGTEEYFTVPTNGFITIQISDGIS